MEIRLSVSEVEACPDDVTVHDYDQLDPEAKQHLAELELDQTAALEIPPGLASSFRHRELINYTAYLHVRRTDETD